MEKNSVIVSGNDNTVTQGTQEKHLNITNAYLVTDIKQISNLLSGALYTDLAEATHKALKLKGKVISVQQWGSACLQLGQNN